MSNEIRLWVRPGVRHEVAELLKAWHRHHGATTGYRFSIVAMAGQRVCGAAIVGRPSARLTSSADVAEVTRLVTDGTPNACSLLYGRCATAAKAMGFARIQTFILESESGASLRAAGWRYDGDSAGGSWDRPSRGRTDDHPTEPKRRYVVDFAAARPA